MSKYSRLPGAKKQEPVIKEPPKMPISKLCCLPILMENNPGYKQQLSSILSLEELLPRVQRLQIYQMLYMDKLLTQLREYRPEMKDEQPKDPVEVLSKMDKSGMVNTMSKIMKYKQTGDMSALMEVIAPDNPMLSMLLPMLSGGGSNMMESLMPMMTGGNMDLSSLFKM